VTARLSAVIVAWNAGSTLAPCVRSLRDSADRAGEPIQVVVVDNASSDLAVDNLRLEQDDVVVRNPLNAGYGVAAAQGIARSAAPWILLVNPDLVVDPDFVGALLGAAEDAPPAVATLVPELRFASRPDVVNCRGLTVDEIGVPAEVDLGTKVSARPSPSVPVVGGSSGCCLLRAEHVRRLGGPEPAFFAYLEDVDLAVRFRRAGYEVLFVPQAVAFHEGSASTGARSPLKIFLVARNRRLLFRLHGPWSVRTRAWRTLIEMGHGLYSSLDAPLAPWFGRLDALRMRRYVDYLQRSRSSGEPCASEFERPRRASMSATLRRKRATARDDEGAAHSPESEP
jgi:GT2 family glycosyltransferase